MSTVEALNGTGTDLVRVDNLSVAVAGRGGAPILDSVSFVVKPGKMTALVGESGAGKSMTTKAVLGALDPRVFKVTGDIELCGQDLGALNDRARHRFVTQHAALVFQNPTKALNPTMHVGPQIAEAMRFAIGRDHLSEAEAREKAIDLMRQVGIAAPEERYHAFPHQMSGGMKQRAVIAIALSLNPEVLFCDEPTSSLDVTTQALIMDLLDELRERLGIGILFITHDLVLAASRADDVMVLHSGRVIESLPANALFESAAMPYTRDLIARVPEPGHPLPIPREVVELPWATGRHSCSYAKQCSFVTELCAERVPPMAQLAPDHTARCWFPIGYPALAVDAETAETPERSAAR